MGTTKIDVGHVQSEFLNFRQGAALLGISIRSFHALRAESWFPAPLELGPRLLRWRRSELVEALANRAPRQTARAEPAELASARESGTKVVGLAGRSQRPTVAA